MKRKLRDYHEKLLEDLQDPQEADAYLGQALKDEDPRIFLLALKNVIEARKLARTKLLTQSVYIQKNNE